MKPSLSLLSGLWLSERDKNLIDAAVEAGFPDATVEELTPAYSDLFLLNVYPYGSVFTEPAGEMNGPSAGELALRYEQAGFAPPELFQVGAVDHIGLCLAFLETLSQRPSAGSRFAAEVLEWAPIPSIAIDRDSSAHPFYKHLARTTIDQLFDLGKDQMRRSRLPAVSLEEEQVGLEEVVSFLLAPARCGLFLSRSRLGELARAVDLALPFGSRRDVCRSLFLSAGERGAIPSLIELLTREVFQWKAALDDLAALRPAWRSCEQTWT